jgi:hypothetical protein
MASDSGTDATAGRWDRFVGILTDPLNRRSATAAPIAEETLTAAEQQAFLLSEWANRSACREHFLPFLDSLIADANAMVSADVVNHALVSYAIGSRDALVALRGHFQNWAGTAE